MDNIIRNKQFDEERALYGSNGVIAIDCNFDGPADGESAFKESRNVEVAGCYFNLRYPFWHDHDVVITDSEMTDKCRAALWYTDRVVIADTLMHGIKALRECSDIKIDHCDIISPEFGWSVSGLVMRETDAKGDYFMMRSDNLDFENVALEGKYAFQYVSDSKFTNCEFNTKDAFWHAKNVVVKDSIVNGEYLAWYSENVTFENCLIKGTQPLCYCKGLKLIDCKMVDADLSFEKSEVDATITTGVISIKNPLRGRIEVPSVDKIIRDDLDSLADIIVNGESR